MAITLDGTNGITSSGDLTLNNGNADGAQVKLSSSGYSDWNLDNYSGRFRAYYNATERFTIDTSGNVGIGVTPKSWASPDVPALDIGGYYAIFNSSSNISGGLAANSFYDGSWKYKNTGAASLFTQDNGTFNFFYTGSGSANSAITWTQAMKIDSSGNVLVGTTDASENAGPGIKAINSTTDAVVRVVANSATAGNSGYVLYNTNATNNGYRFFVKYNGGISNYSANNTNLSDQRLKTDITPAKSYLDTICSIPVVTFKYKDQTDEELNLGVIAQSVDAVAPELVDHSGFGETPEGESPYLAVYQTDLQYALMKCIQEQQELIKALTSRIETLEAK